jgi:hypothetical protein
MAPIQPPDAWIWSVCSEADAGIAVATAGCADTATATPTASAKAPARLMYLAGPNHSSPVLPRRVAEFAPPPQGRDVRCPKTRVVHYLFLATARPTQEPRVARSLLVCNEKTGRSS